MAKVVRGVDSYKKEFLSIFNSLCGRHGRWEAIEEGEPRAEFVQATFEIDPNDPAHLIPTVEVNIRDE